MIAMIYTINNHSLYFIYAFLPVQTFFRVLLERKKAGSTFRYCRLHNYYVFVL
jgi:hypothetical protein